jgi:hypothetical protein
MKKLHGCGDHDIVNGLILFFKAEYFDTGDLPFFAEIVYL